MRGFNRWCIAIVAAGGVVAGCRGAPWQHVAPTPDTCAQRGALTQEIATLDAKLRRGEFPVTPPALVAGSAAASGDPGGGPMGGSAARLNLERRADAASASDGGTSAQTASNVALAKSDYVMEENASRDRRAIANVAGIGTAGSAVAANAVSLQQAAQPMPRTRAEAQARIGVLRKRLWDLPSSASCRKLGGGTSSAS